MIVNIRNILARILKRFGVHFLTILILRYGLVEVAGGGLLTLLLRPVRMVLTHRALVVR